MKVKITESQLKLIAENQEKDNAIIDKMFARYGTKSIGYSEMQDIGNKLYNMGILELPENHKGGEDHPMTRQILVNEAKRLRLEYLKRSGTQLYQLTLYERVYASVAVTYIVTSDDEDEVREQLGDGSHVDEIHAKDENGDLKADFEDWMDDSLMDALDYEELEIEPYTGTLPSVRPEGA